ncbi:thioesterase domain-containing protein [Aquibium microcysteis]|uniref:thioesterase domain-containing protein n=1 Tax=Aquibium microcysteis TaxID=675281 RepID=UPI00165D0A9B|nr:thioesterase domain-containing protein [Aquibium microcysteis]
MTRLWAEVLDVDTVGLDDDFFELGGDSLVAATLVAAVKAGFATEMRESQIPELNTPRRLLTLVSDHAGPARAALPSNVVAINPDGRRAPIFLIHGAAGIVFLKPRFRDALHPDQPVYIFQAQGYDGAAPPLDTVEAIAAGYLQSILKVQPEPPWHLASFCAGGWIAVDIVRQMQLEGRTPATVVLVDTNLPSGMRKDYSLKRIHVGGIRLPALPDPIVGMIKGSYGLVRRMKLFLKTGRFKDVHDPEAFEDPAIRRRLVSDMQRHNRQRGTKRTKVFAEGAESAALAQEADALDGIFGSEAAALTTTLLRRAYRAYVPAPSDFPFSFIVSTRRSAAFGDPDYPINRLLPNRNVVISGESHEDAVSSRETAQLIQRLVDGDHA